MTPLVSLVGAGPGDPGLVTVRALERLRAAEVVVYDRLAPAVLLREAPPAARLIDVGKAPGRAEMSQDDINELLVGEGRAGRRVVRLKGGDPFVFGRGGEEAQALAAANVPFEIVPGITSAIAAPAYAGIPVTHRGVATHVTIVTGHEDPTKPGRQTDWQAIGRSGGSLVILMGVGRLAAITGELQAAGRPGDEPAAAVMWGTTGRQRVVQSTLGHIADQAIASPAVVVVGAVAALAGEIGWWAPPPLDGMRVVVTRAREKASVLRATLEGLGASVLEFPAIAFEPPPDPQLLADTMHNLGSYDWVVFTSPTGVERAFAALAPADARAFGRAKVAAIGPGTEAALAGHGIRADLLPPVFVAESLGEALPPGQGRVVLLRAEEAREALPEILSAKGWSVDVVPAYRTVLGEGDPRTRAALAAGEVDAVTFTASSTVKHFVALAGEVPRPPVVASIGPITSATARELGWAPTVEATEHTLSGLVAALRSGWAARDE